MFRGGIAVFCDPSTFMPPEYNRQTIVDFFERMEHNPKIIGTTAGCHPKKAHLWNSDVAAYLRELHYEKVSTFKAIGECGIDRNSLVFLPFYILIIHSSILGAIISAFKNVYFLNNATLQPNLVKRWSFTHGTTNLEVRRPWPCMEMLMMKFWMFYVRYVYPYSHILLYVGFFRATSKKLIKSIDIVLLILWLLHSEHDTSILICSLASLLSWFISPLPI